jgi:putative ABC transport system permease protein
VSLRGMVATAREWLARLLGTLRGRSNESELESELSYHLELAEEHLRNRGYSPAEASRLARARYGRPEQVVERMRDQRGIPWLGHFRLDVKLGLRMLRKYLGLTLIGGLAMSVGFGIIITAFMYFDVVVWSDSVPLEDGERVIAIQIWDPEESRRGETAVDDFERWRSQLKSIEDMGAFRTVEHEFVHADGRTESVSVAEISAAGFRVARVAPVLGRPLLADDERSGAEPVIVIGYDEWQSRFEGEADVLGRAVRLDGQLYTIVGVMPAGFGFPINHRFWIPLHAKSGELLPAPPAGAVYGRLSRGATLETARAELSAVGLLHADAETGRSEPPRPTIVPYAANFVSDTSPDDLVARAWSARLIMLFVSLLLIPPCANIALLVYARTVSRQEEIALRKALGASRARIVLQLFIEMLVLSTLAVCLALIAVRFIAAFFEQFMLRALERLPFWISFELSPNTLLFAAALAVFSALIIGLLPALKATASYRNPGLSALDRRHSLRLGPIFTLLVVAQVAFSFAGLPSAVELAWGVLRSAVLGPGFAADDYLTAQLSLDDQGPLRLSENDRAAALSRFREDLDALVRRLEDDPRVASRVTTGTAVPGEGRWMRFRIEGLEELSPPPDAAGLQIGVPLVRQIGVDDRYFDVFGISVLTGRAFATGESSETSRAVLINATFAHDVFGRANPLGNRISYVRPPAERTANPEADETWYEIVGVVADRPAHPYGGSVFHAWGAGPVYPASIGFRAGPDASGLREELGRMAAAIDPGLNVERIQTLEELYDSQDFGNYIGGFALIAGSLSVLLLAAAGTYALMTFTVNQRRREIAIRMALGAQPRRLLGAVFRRALRPVSVGAALGLAVALLVQRAIPVQRLGGLDVPGVLPSAIVLLLMIGAIAAIGPARRALTADPTDALRDAG